LEAIDLFFEWDLCLTVFSGGLGEEQLTRIKSKGSKILLIIPIFFLSLIIAGSDGMQPDNLAYVVYIPGSYPFGLTNLMY
jgi:hypothetical protein